MDIDTQMIIISNPDLEARLNQHAERAGSDPLKALKRRLDKHEFTYLTNLSLEAELVRRELTNETSVWDAESYDELESRIREPVVIAVRGIDRRVLDRELAPHAVEAAALYDVVSRLDAEDVPPGLDLVDKAVIFDKGYLQDGDERREKEDFSFEESALDGEGGIPVTYTRDVIADLLHEERDRHHPDLDVGNVIMPRDVLNAMAEGLSDAPVFSPSERTEFENRLVPVKNYVFKRQEDDVLEAIMREKRVDEATVEEYVEHVYAWVEGEQIANERGEFEEPDPLKMKVFEVEHLGRFDESDYTGTDPDEGVDEFRREKVVTALNRHAWRNRDEEFRVGDVNVKDIPVIKAVLGSHDWDDVRRTFEDFEPGQWDDPPSGTETESVKRRTLRNMEELFDYSAASAELTSRHVMSQVSYRWD
jgi:predicted Ser/Thr protein kinase